MGTMTKGSRELSYNIYIRNPSSTTTTNGVCMSVFVCVFVCDRGTCGLIHARHQQLVNICA